LERPQRHNRITLELAQALCSAATEIELDDSVLAVSWRHPAELLCRVDTRPWEQRVDWVVPSRS